MNISNKLMSLGALLVLVIVGMGGFYLYQGMQSSSYKDEEFGQRVRAYLLENPAVIREAIEVLTAQERNEEALKNKAALAGSRQELENDGYSFVGGNPNGDVTIVEFFDYRCGYCKRAFPSLMKTVEEDGNIRLVLKEFPILGEQSVLAAQAVMAAQAQGKYMEFHNLLMQARGNLTKDRLLEFGKQLQLDIVRLEADMKSDSITTKIRRTYDLARALGISGTPAFVIGGAISPGAIPAERMKVLVAEARANKAASATN